MARLLPPVAAIFCSVTSAASAMTRWRSTSAAATLISLIGSLAPSVAFAHSVNAKIGGFYAGLIHPITALEHLLPFVVMGLLSGIGKQLGSEVDITTALMPYLASMQINPAAPSHENAE